MSGRRPGQVVERPWHAAPPPSVVAAGRRGPLRGAPAGIATRAVANVIDLVVVLLLVAAGYLAVVAVRFVLSPRTFAFPAVPSGLVLTLVLCTQAVYFAVTWTIFGATYGDRVLALAVGDDRGRRLGWLRSGARALLCTLFPIGLVWVLVSRRNRSIQDLIVRSSVVYD